MENNFFNVDIKIDDLIYQGNNQAKLVIYNDRLEINSNDVVIETVNYNNIKDMVVDNTVLSIMIDNGKTIFVNSFNIMEIYQSIINHKNSINNTNNVIDNTSIPIEETAIVKKKNGIITILLTLLVLVIVAVVLYFVISSEKEKCPDGYTYKHDQCVKVIIDEPMIIKYCDGDYVLDGDKCKKVETLNATKTYNCPKLSNKDPIRVSAPISLGSQCRYTLSYDAIEEKYCLSGCYLKSQNQCACKIDLPPDYRQIGTDLVPYCVGDFYYERSSNKCVMYTYPSPQIRKKCTEDSILIGNECRKDITGPANETVSCPNGYQVKGYYCEKTIIIDAKENYNCLNGYELVNARCQKEIIYEK